MSDPREIEPFWDLSKPFPDEIEIDGKMLPLNRELTPEEDAAWKKGTPFENSPTPYNVLWMKFGMPLIIPYIIRDGKIVESHIPIEQAEAMERRMNAERYFTATRDTSLLFKEGMWPKSEILTEYDMRHRWESRQRAQAEVDAQRAAEEARDKLRKGAAMNPYQAAFGKHLRDLRRQQDLTQEEVAHRADLHVTYLSGIERGVRNPSLKNIRAIARALGAPTADLFAFEEQAPHAPEEIDRDNAASD